MEIKRDTLEGYIDRLIDSSAQNGEARNAVAAYAIENLEYTELSSGRWVDRASESGRSVHANNHGLYVGKYNLVLRSVADGFLLTIHQQPWMVFPQGPENAKEFPAPLVSMPACLHMDKEGHPDWFGSGGEVVTLEDRRSVLDRLRLRPKMTEIAWLSEEVWGANVGKHHDIFRIVLSVKNEGHGMSGR